MAKIVRDKDRRSFKESTENMTNTEKMSYIWEYYKWIILGSIAGIFLVFSFVHTFLTRTEPYLSITFISGFEHTLTSFDPDMENESASTTPVGIWIDLDVIPILEEILLDDKQPNRYEIALQHLSINFETMPVFSTHTGAGVIDMLITYIPDAYAMSEIGHFKNISDLGWNIPAYKMHDDYTVYLRYFPIFDEYVAAPYDLVVGITINTQNLEHVKAFFDALLD